MPCSKQLAKLSSCSLLIDEGLVALQMSHVMQATGPASSDSERPAARGRSRSAKRTRTAYPVLVKRSGSARRPTGKREHAHAQNEELQVS